jgi:hypothetical protein
MSDTATATSVRTGNYNVDPTTPASASSPATRW